MASGPGGAPTLDGNRKLAIINGMGDHSRAQGNSSAVKEAIGAFFGWFTHGSWILCSNGCARRDGHMP